jgi:hypothetical protein
MVNTAEREHDFTWAARWEFTEHLWTANPAAAVEHLYGEWTDELRRRADPATTEAFLRRCARADADLAEHRRELARRITALRSQRRRGR